RSPHHPAPRRTHIARAASENVSRRLAHISLFFDVQSTLVVSDPRRRLYRLWFTWLSGGHAGFAHRGIAPSTLTRCCSLASPSYAAINGFSSPSLPKHSPLPRDSFRQIGTWNAFSNS